jgi:hypothetical protein
MNFEKMRFGGIRRPRDRVVGSQPSGSAWRYWQAKKIRRARTKGRGPKARRWGKSKGGGNGSRWNRWLAGGAPDCGWPLPSSESRKFFIEARRIFFKSSASRCGLEWLPFKTTWKAFCLALSQ